MAAAALGIDLGTSTTIAARCDGAQVRPVADARGVSILPSVVAFPPSGGFLVGAEAKHRRPIDGANTLFSFKRIIGQPFSSSSVEAYQRHYPFDLENDAGVPRFRTRGGRFSAVQVSARLISHLSELLGQERSVLSRVAVGVPVEFQPHQREAIVQALHEGGLSGAVCVEEPAAVLRAYQGVLPPTARRVAVYDLGGGTFNFAVAELTPTGPQMLAAGGDDYLGGDDIDGLCADWVTARALDDFSWDLSNNPQSRTRLLAACEQAKMTLSSMLATRIKLGAIEQNDAMGSCEITLERQVLDGLIADVVRRTFVACDEVLARLSLSAAHIDAVVLAGGSSRIPYLQNAVAHYFGKSPLIDQAPENLVAMGAAWLAHATVVPSAKQLVSSHTNQRKTERLTVSVQVSVDLGPHGKVDQAVATDVSKGGMFIRLSLNVPLQTPLLVTLAVGPNVFLTLPARVVHCTTAQTSAAHNLPPGIGVQFLELAAEHRHKLESWLARALPLFGVSR